MTESQEDQDWRNLIEHTLLFDDSLVNLKYHSLETQNRKSTSVPQKVPTQKKNLRDEQIKFQRDLSLVGVIRDFDVYEKALSLWTRDLTETTSLPLEGSESLLSLFEKRLKVLKHLQNVQLREISPTTAASTTTTVKKTEVSTDKTSVPVVVRLSVLTIFPLVETLKNLAGVDYLKLSRQILQIMVSVLSELPPLALIKEPADCLDAFESFIYSIMNRPELSLTSTEKILATTALVGLALSRGSAKHLLLVVEALFRIQKTFSPTGSKSITTSPEIPLFPVSALIKQLSAHKKQVELGVIFEKGMQGFRPASYTPLTIPNNNSPKTPENKTKQLSSCVTTDGTFLFIFNSNIGLCKLGSGFGRSIQGYLYSQNNHHHKTENSTNISLSFISPNLYYYSAQLNQTIPKGSITLAVVDPVTLKETGTKKLSTNCDPQNSYVVSDQKRLYIFSIIEQQSPEQANSLTSSASKREDEDKEKQKEHIRLEIFERENDEFVKVKALILVSPFFDKLCSTPNLVQLYDKGNFYATGFHLILVVPLGAANKEPTNTRTRVFSLIDGALTTDIVVKADSQGFSLSYDYTNNLIWSYSQVDNQVAFYKNLTSKFSPNPKSTPYSPISSEYILSRFENLSSYTPTQLIMVLLGNMDRLARQHPLYEEVAIVTSSMGPPFIQHFTIDFKDISIFQTLYSILSHSLECVETSGQVSDEMVYVIVASLRLLKVNIYEFILDCFQTEGNLTKRSQEDVFLRLRTLLLDFVNDKLNTLLQSYAQAIQEESCNILTVGFCLFYPSLDQQRNLLYTLLSPSYQGSQSSQGHKALLELLLTELSLSDIASEIFLQPISKEVNVTDLPDVETASESDAEQSVNFKSCLLPYLLEFAVHESLGQIQDFASCFTSPIGTPAIFLLLILQRYMISETRYQSLLFHYSVALVQKSKIILDHVAHVKKTVQQDQSSPIDSDQKLIHAVRNSLFGTVFQSLLYCLGRKRHVTRSSFVSSLLPHLLDIATSIDSVTQLFPECKKADENYLLRNTSRSHKKAIVETKHPYFYGKKQIIQTVKISGAKALCLHFDSRSATASNNDMLQLFKTSMLNEPYLNQRDGTPYVFSGKSWPKQAIVLQGESVTFHFNSTSKPDTSTSLHPSKWGFRCIVTEHTTSATHQKVINNWLLDLENMIVLLITKYLGSVILGPIQDESEVKLAPWIDAQLLNCNDGGNLEDETQPESSDFLSKFVLGSTETQPFYEWIQKRVSNKPLMTETSRAPIQNAERAVIAAIIKHLGLLERVITISSALSQGNTPEPDPIDEVFFVIGQKIIKIVKWLLHRGQLLKMWSLALEDHETFEWEQDPHRLRELCELKEVEFDPLSERDTVNRLYDKLLKEKQEKQRDQATGIIMDDETNPYATAAKPLIQRAQLLLKLKSSHFSLDNIRNSVSQGTDILFPSYEKKEPRGVSQRSLKKGSSAKKGKLSHLTNPLQIIISFLESPFNHAEIEKVLNLQVQRAKSRIEGLKCLYKLLTLTSFSSTKHQILSTIGTNLFIGGYYDEGIFASGPQFLSAVSEHFKLVFQKLIEILQDPNSDTISKLLALNICGMKFQPQDAVLLSSSNILSLLREMIAESEKQLSTKKSSESLTSSRPNSKTAVQKKGISERSYSENEPELKHLISAAWTSFCLLASHICSWSEHSDLRVGEQLRDSVFGLLELELERITKNSTSDEDYFRLVSLMYLLSIKSEVARQSLSRDKIMNQLTNVLMSPESTPRSKRLTLRLSRLLLPFQTPQSFSSFVPFLFREIGNLLLPPVPLHWEQTKSSLFSEASIGAGGSGDSSAASSGGTGQLYGLYLNIWSAGYKKLMDTCHSTSGTNFFLPNVSGASSQARMITEFRVKQILQEMEEKGQALLKVGTKEECSRLISHITSVGGTVTLKPVSSHQSPGKHSNRNKIKYKNSLPKKWVSGRVSRSIASEYIALIRELLEPSENGPTHTLRQWSQALNDYLISCIECLPELINQLQGGISLHDTLTKNTDRVANSIAALSIMGGFVESIRTGGRVKDTQTHLKKYGTVMDYPPDGSGCVEVIFDSDPTKPQRIEVSKLQPIPEIPAKSSRLPPFSRILPSIIGFIRTFSSDSFYHTWLFHEFQSRAMRVLYTLLCGQDEQISQTNSTSLRREDLLRLIELAKNSSSDSRLSILEPVALSKAERLWDIHTLPEDNHDLAKTISDVLPHFPGIQAFQNDPLPSCWEKTRAQGLGFTGAGRRTVEFFPLASSNRSNRRRTDSATANNQTLLSANLPIPKSVSLYYFEVTVEKCEQSATQISVGLSPEKSTQWRDGSYRYQNNSKKVWYVGGSQRQSNYGSFYRTGNVVGCLLNKEEQTIKFTRDGAEIGVAFHEVSSNPPLVPCVGLAPGVRVRINFGQEPFLFNLSPPPSDEDEETREKRKQEEEARRKAEREEEEARRKKEKEYEEAAKKEAAQPLMAMGYDLKRALKALEVTGYSGTENAVMWLLENAETAFDDEEEEPKEEEDKPMTDATPQKQAEESQEQKDSTSLNVDLVAIPEEKYNSSFSSSFILGDCFRFPSNIQAQFQTPDNAILNDWEERIIPDLKRFMESNGFSKFEVDEFLTQIRLQLAQNNQTEAGHLVLRIVGDSSSTFRLPTRTVLPSSISITGTAKSNIPLKIEEVQLHQWVSVSKTANRDDPQDLWLPQMDKTLSAIGLVKSIDYEENLVLVQFYELESGILDEWWYDVSQLQTPDQLVEKPFSVPSREKEILNLVCQTNFELSCLYSRKALLSLFPYREDTEEVSKLLPDILYLAAFDSLESRILQITSSTRPKQSTSEKRLTKFLKTLHSSNQDSSIQQNLVNEIQSLYETCREYVAKCSTLVSSKPNVQEPEKIHVEEARSLAVVFQKQCFIPPNSNCHLLIFQDENLTHLLANYEAEKTNTTSAAPTNFMTPFAPLLVPAKQFWIQFQTSSSASASIAALSNCKYKLAVVGIRPELNLLCWLVEILRQNLPKHLSKLEKLFEFSINFTYSCTAPSIVKESAFYLLSILLFKCHKNQYGTQFPFQRFEKLQDELFNLYEIERKRPALYSTYLQSLLELLAISQLYRTSPISSMTDPQDPSNMELSLALALTTSFRKSSDSTNKTPIGTTPQDLSMTTPSSVNKSPTPNGTSSTTPDSLSTSLSMDISGPNPFEQTPEQTSQLEHLLDSNMMDFEDDEIDDDLRAAIALSVQMSQPGPSSTHVADPPPGGSGPESSAPATDAPVSPSATTDMTIENPIASSEEKSSPTTESTSSKTTTATATTTTTTTTTTATPTTNAGDSKNTTMTTPIKTSTAGPTQQHIWFDQMTELAAILQYFNSRKEKNYQLTKMVMEKPWTQSKSQDLKGRLIVVDNLPVVSTPQDQQSLRSLLKNTLSEVDIKSEVIFLAQEPTTSSITPSLPSLSAVPEDSSSSLTPPEPTTISLPNSESSMDSNLHSFAILEIFLEEKVPEAVIRLSSYKFTFPAHEETLSKPDSSSPTESNPTTPPSSSNSSPSLSPIAPSTPKSLSQTKSGSSEFILGVHTFNELEESRDPRIKSFLSSLLIDSTQQSLTGQATAVFLEIFHLFSENSPVISPYQLDALQICTNSEPLGEQGIQYLLKNFETAPIPPTEAKANGTTSTDQALKVGLTRKGFLDTYYKQSKDLPFDTWEELSQLGYDLQFNRQYFLTLEQATRSQLQWDNIMDEQFLLLIEELVSNLELTSPTELSMTNIKPDIISINGKVCQKLKEISIASLRLRFNFLQHFNSLLLNTLPLVNFNMLRQEGTLAYYLSTYRDFIFHSVKMQFCYEVLDKTSVLGNQPSVTIDRLRLVSKKEEETGIPQSSMDENKIILSRTVFGIAFEQLKLIPPEYFRQRKPVGTEPHFSVRVLFKGEHVEGEGGPYRQLFTDISKELHSVLPLLSPCPNAKAMVGENREKFIINPSRTSSTDLAMFKFLGQLMGIAVRTGVLLPLDFPSFIWKQLVGISPDIEDLRKIDFALYSTISFLQDCTKSEFGEGDERIFFEHFVVSLSDGSQIPLKENGETIEVTYENRLEFVELVKKARLTESRLQIEAIVSGLSEIIPPALLHIFKWQDLEWRIGGKPHIDISLLKRHTEYSTVSPEAPHISYFWQTLQQMTQSDRRKFVRFAWAQERLPADDQEFYRTQTRMLIKPFSDLKDPDSAFPKADTCFFNLMLPEYSSQSVLREKLMFAINNTDTMDADQLQEDSGQMDSPAEEYSSSGSDSE